MTRSQGKSVAIAFLLGAFLTGGTLGFAYGRTTGTTNKDEKTASRAYNYSGMVRELQRDLSLTDSQTAVVDSILKWRRAMQNERLIPLQPSIDSLRDSARVLIMQRLDESQREKFQNLIDDISARSDSTRAASKER